MKIFLRVIIVVVLVLCLRATAAFPQGGTATVTGKVSDPGGLTVPGVNVQAVNANTNVAYPATTNEAGIYTLSNLPPGEYRITVDKEGFQPVVRPGVVLHVADNISIDFALQVGSTTQTITVEGGAPLVNTTDSTLGGLVESEEISNLPMNGRNYIALTLMLPGISPNQNTATTATVGLGTWYSSNGAPVRANNFMLDGAIMQDATGGGTGTYSGRTLGLDGIQEYRVITNSFSAEYGLLAGSQTVMVSKSGTNQFHGSVFEYIRNSALDAANYFDAPTAANNFRRLPEFQRNNFGASLGGPIKRDKTFFFATFEGVKEAKGITVNDTVPAANCHGPAGAVIWNGMGGQPTGSIGPCTQLGANPAGAGTNSVKIAASVAPLLALYPVPNLPLNGFTTPFTQPDTDWFGQGRVDHVFSTKDSVFARYTADYDDQTQGLAYPEYFVTPRITHHKYLTLAENHIFSTSLINNVRFSDSRTYTNQTSPTPSNLLAPQYEIQSPVGGLAGFGQFSIGGITALAPNKAQAQVGSQHVDSIRDDLLYTFGNHAIKIGVSADRWHQYYATALPFGSASFGSLATFLAGTASSYFVQNTVSPLPPAVNVRGYTWYTTAFYVQDDWRLKRNFTLNLGLRYEPAFNYIDETHGWSSALIHLSDTAFTVGPFFKNPTYKNFSPRLGFAWDVTGDGKTAIRGAGSILDDLGSLSTALGVATGNGGGDPPFLFQTQTSTNCIAAFTVPLTIPSCAAVGKTVATFPYDMKPTKFFTWNLTVERQLPFTMALAVSYVGSRGEHIYGTGEWNPNVPLSITNGVPVWDPNPKDTLQTINPAWASVQLTGTYRDSSFNALEITLDKRITKGLTFKASYTNEKMFDNEQGSVGDSTYTNAYPANPFNSRWGRELSSFDIPQNFVINFVYTLPSPKIQERVLATMTSGWGLSGIFSTHSGVPFSVAETVERSRSGVAGGANQFAGIDQPNWNPAFTGNVIEGNPTQYYNPAAFVLQPVGQLGNVRRDSLFGPGFEEFDFSLQKDTKLRFLGEGGNLEFRSEFFNLFNRPNFVNPSTSVFAGTLTDATEAPLSSAGQILSTIGTSRQIEFSLRISF